MKKKTYEKPLIRAIQLKSHRVLLVGSPNGQTEDLNEQQDWTQDWTQKGGWS